MIDIAARIYQALREPEKLSMKTRKVCDGRFA
jgi:hypothetical protein